GSSPLPPTPWLGFPSAGSSSCSRVPRHHRPPCLLVAARADAAVAAGAERLSAGHRHNEQEEAATSFAKSSRNPPPLAVLVPPRALLDSLHSPVFFLVREIEKGGRLFTPSQARPTSSSL
ncbi:unnamed protein product, partial [Urochloa humidicola]